MNAPLIPVTCSFKTGKLTKILSFWTSCKNVSCKNGLTTHLSINYINKINLKLFINYYLFVGWLVGWSIKLPIKLSNRFIFNSQFIFCKTLKCALYLSVSRFSPSSPSRPLFSALCGGSSWLLQASESWVLVFSFPSLSWSNETLWLLVILEWL